MKKLLTAVAIIGFAAVTNAATFKWNTGAQAYGPSVANLTPDASGNYAVGTATADRMKSEGSNQGVTWTYVMLLSDGTNNERLEGTITTYSSNKIAQNVTTTSIDIPSNDNPVTISWEIVITGTKTTDDGTYTYVSDTINGSAVYSSLSPREISTVVPTSWDITVPTPPTPPVAPVVPEPTTGLLVLLGIAGLALKRKQA